MPKRSVWMSEDEYKLVVQKTPIPTIDLVVLRQNGGRWETLLLVRRTGYEAGNWCVIGGRQRLGETAKEGIERQADDLGVRVEIIPPFEANFPAWVHDDPLQDRTKHACTNVYPVRIVEGNVQKEGEEFTASKWFSIDELPEMAYHGRFEVIKAVEQLKKFGGRL